MELQLLLVQCVGVIGSAHITPRRCLSSMPSPVHSVWLPLLLPVHAAPLGPSFCRPCHAAGVALQQVPHCRTLQHKSNTARHSIAQHEKLYNIRHRHSASFCTDAPTLYSHVCTGACAAFHAGSCAADQLQSLYAFKSSVATLSTLGNHTTPMLIPAQPAADVTYSGLQSLHAVQGTTL